MANRGMPARPNAAEMSQLCAAFNELYAIGDRIRAYPGAIGGELVDVEIVEPGAHVLGGHTAVVQVSGRGCIALTHIHGRAR